MLAGVLGRGTGKGEGAGWFCILAFWLFWALAAALAHLGSRLRVGDRVGRLLAHS